MPVVGIDISRLRKMMGADIENDRLIKILTEMGCDVEGFATLQRFLCLNCQGITELTSEEDRPAYCSVCGIDFREMPGKMQEIDPIHVIRMEILAVRPDIFDAGGLSRAVKGYLGIETGLKKYKLHAHEETITVTGGIDKIRPFIVSAVIKNITMDDDFIKTIMKLQENLHWALGRNRKHASIGVYDYDRVKGGFTYTAKDPGFRFVPLGYEINEENRISLKKILESHPKGVGYSFILDGFDKYPVLMDSRDMVLSMPPIINSEDTKVTKDTRNIIIDVTGPIERVINKTLNIIVTSILEYFPEAECRQVLVKYPDREMVTPDFSIESMDIGISETASLIGVDISGKDQAEFLRKMRHDSDIVDDNTIRCHIPPYRNDIIHPRDLMEDIAIAYGYHNIIPSLIETMTVGQERPLERLCSRARKVMAGLGFLEISTLMLTNAEYHYEMLGLPYNSATVEIDNPISVEQTILRTHLISGLMESFRHNIHNDLPQKLFEVNDVTLIKESETGAVDEKHASAGIIGARATFSEIKAYLTAFMGEMNREFALEALDTGLFIPGRGASVVINGIRAGMFGEVHPEVLEKYHLVHPVALFEVQLALQA